jgi:hypothetical protein
MLDQNPRQMGSGGGSYIFTWLAQIMLTEHTNFRRKGALESQASREPFIVWQFCSNQNHLRQISSLSSVFLYVV